MIDHVGVAVGDFAKSKEWYAKALAPIGYKVMMEFPAEQAGGQPAAGSATASPISGSRAAARRSRTRTSPSR